MTPTTETYTHDDDKFVKLTYEGESIRDEENLDESEYVFKVTDNGQVKLHSVRSGTGWGIVYIEDVFRAIEDIKQEYDYDPVR